MLHLIWMLPGFGLGVAACLVSMGATRSRRHEARKRVTVPPPLIGPRGGAGDSGAAKR